MGAASVGRNDPCPCGSGKKYKKCCLPKEASVRPDPLPGPPPQPTSGPASWNLEDEVDDLDEISNGAVDAIKAKRYEEAERLCERLLQEYPEVFDGHDRLAMLREAQGRYQEAADHYSEALAIMERHAGDYGEKLVEAVRNRKREALSRLQRQG